MKKNEQKEPLTKEQERALNNKLKNQPILVITYCMVAVFMCLFGYIIYFMQFKAETVIANSRNIRQDSFAETIERGDIITSDNVVIATSETDESGVTNRTYPYKNMFAHLVGYDMRGKSGLELTGNFYMLRSHINVFERVYDDLRMKKKRGDNVITTVRYDLQKVAYDALGSCKGAVVVMEPDTGRILTMLSKPDFDANDMEAVWNYLDTEEGAGSTILVNRATQGLYAPGSTFKVITLLEYIREHPDYDSYTYTCNGSDIFAGVNIHCYDSTVHGEETLADSLAYSCNSSFANLGVSLDYASYRNTVDNLLFNKELPYDGEYNKSSFEINAGSRKDELPQTVIGQGNTKISPLHNAMIFSAFANGGILMKPYLIDRIENDDGRNVKKFQPKAYGELVTTTEANILCEYMKGVCEYGTAARFFGDAPYAVAGKTGTAEYDNEGNCNSWFVGFSNPDNPDIVVSVIVEDYNTNGVSATWVARQIFDAYYK